MQRTLLLNFLFSFLFLNEIASAAIFNMEFSCNEIDKNIAAVQKWTRSRSVSCTMESPASVDLGGGQCSADFTKCLPPEVLAWDSTAPEIAGPNCWNLAMVMSGVLPSLRYSSADEMSFFMKSPLCRQLQAHEKPEPGDVGALRANGKEVHGFMWISDTLVFSKNGDSAKQKYSLQSTEFMTSGYQRLQDAECARTKDPADCAMFVDTLRCQSLDSYIKDPRTETPKEIAEAFSRLDAADVCLKPMHFNPQAFSDQHMRNLTETMEVMAATVQSADFKKSLSAMKKQDRDFISGSLQVRLESMRLQLTQNQKERKTCAGCEAMIETLKRTYAEIETE